MTWRRSPPKVSSMGCSVPEGPVARLRPAVEDDVPAIVAIYNASVAVNTASWDTAPHSVAERLAWFHDRTRAGQAVLVAEQDGRVVGWAAWGPFRSKAGYRLTMEHTLYVAESARGQGVGRLLMAGILETAAAAGVHVLVGAVSADNEASIALHERFGFVDVGRMPQVGAKFGRWLDLVLLHKQLDDRPVP